MDFQLVRGGVLSGRVTTKDGEPMVEQPINLIPLEVRPAPSFAIPSGPCPQAIRGTARLLRGNTLIAGALVDTRGEFLFERIPAGEYKLVVTPEAPGFRGAPKAPQQIVIAEGINQDISVTAILVQPRTSFLCCQAHGARIFVRLFT